MNTVRGQMRAWLRELWTGDDGYIYAVVTEPSPFRIAESVLHGPFTKRAAWRYARAFIAAYPYGEARLSKAVKGATWPPKLNRSVE